MTIKANKKSKVWVVYILRCSDKSLYTGITNNIKKRFAAHDSGVAAKYTRSRRPVKLLATSAKMDRVSAMRLELKIKNLPKEKKLSMLKKTAKAKSKTSICAVKKSSIPSKATLKNLAGLWQVHLKKLHHKIPIQGSPERSLFRVVFEDINGRYFLLEQIPPQSLEHKKQIAEILDLLAKENLARIQPYMADENGNNVIKHKNNFWQISPFVRGEELNREKYIYEKWRGNALATFLIQLRRKSRRLSLADFCNVFSLKNYMYKLVWEINLYNKNIEDEISKVVKFLEKDFMPMYEKLPVVFCHGDYHPLNVIWSADDIKCVIDWEFCGFKSELYDIANLIGCVGVENPQSLTGDLVKSFIADLKKAKIISQRSWKYLLEFVVALRFAWMAEWLRRKDEEMIRLELDYMRLLIDNINSLQKAWL
ncbi:MAG: phosphotransferase [Syntrophaceae bacterium]|nr:phosphotransferase [Syntrophaceae bacterium]